MSEETITSEVLAASLGGAISASILYPLEVTKTKMQALPAASEDDDGYDDAYENDIDDKGEPSVVTTKNLTMIQFMQQLYQKEGYAVFFRGMETSAFQSALEKALYFFAYTSLKEGYTFVAGKNQPMGGWTNLLLGCAAEWAHLPITLPVDAWTTKIQTSTEKPMAILVTMLNDKSTNFYKGIQAYWLLCLKPALQYTVYEQVKLFWVKTRKNKSLTAAEAFLLGMIARTIATVVVFPFLRAKVMLQAAKQHQQQQHQNQTANEQQQQETSLPMLLLDIWQRTGVAGLYQGLGPELTRGVLSAALMLMIKEKVAVMVRTLLAPPAPSKQ